MTGSTSTPPALPTVPLAAATCAALLALALVAGPHACEWGWGVYFWAGLAAVLMLAAMPFLPWFKRRPGRAALQCSQLVALGCGTWVAGLFIADFQILCRLF
jgi:hypothetical protein